MRSVGCVAILMASCCGCCCGRLPTFGLWPEVDEAAARAAVLDAPFVVDNLCTVEKHCVAVQDAEVDVVPVGWNPLTDNVAVLIAVEARCVASEEALEQAQPFVCAGVLGGVGAAGSTVVVTEVTEWATTGLPTSGQRLLPGEYSGGGGGDFDWD